MARILLSALFVTPIAVGCGRQFGLDATRKLGQQLNASSPLTSPMSRTSSARGCKVTLYPLHQRCNDMFGVLTIP